MAIGRNPHAHAGERPALLQEGWVIANHILVSFHVAFISSILALPAAAASKGFVLRFIFASPETIVSALFTYVSFHAGIALHEIGHFRKAARLHALNQDILETVEGQLRQPFLRRLLYYARVFLLAPYGRAPGIKREGLNYYADAPYNLAVAAAGPEASRNVAWITLPPALLLLATGLLAGAPGPIYAGRLLLGIGVVTLLDFLLADPGKYREFRERERRAQESADALPEATSWYATAPVLKRKLAEGRMREAMHPRLGAVTSPWQFRNCGMGGRHTETEYPESNISMQEAMFLILGARDAQEAQEMTVRLQNRLKEIIEKEDGCRVMGIGLEGGLAPYIDPGGYALPELRLWAMMKRAIEECGYRPGADVAIALDPALSELETAYRTEFNLPDSVGMYLFWRDQAKTVLDRDGVLDIYEKAILEYEMPVLSIEDGFSEHDDEGWKKLLETLGERIFVIGDDLVTTNDRTIETAAARRLINAVLVKANQIGSLYETLLAVLVTMGKGLEVVVSHRSKSPNDDMEAHIALAANALGLKAGGGANTERLVKYQAVATLMERVSEAAAPGAVDAVPVAIARKIRAYEEPTNAGIPTVGVEVELALPQAGVSLSFKGATPLGTSAGTGEAVHLVDRFVEYAEDREPIDRHPELFSEVELGVYSFKDKVTSAQVEATGDAALGALFARTQRYQGKGCLNAVANVHQLIAPHFENRDLYACGLLDIDRALLGLELETARRRGKLAADASAEEVIGVLQRKQNLGMNAILSMSLALARAVAHVQGKRLHELIREEMLAIIERLAEAHEIRIGGSRFSDYVAALREANRILEAQGKPLYEELRRLTGIYEQAEDTPAPARVPIEPSAPARLLMEPWAAPVSRADDLPPTAAAPALAAVDGDTPEPPPEPFGDAERREIETLNEALYEAYVSDPSDNDREAALRRYLATRAAVGKRVRSFGIANHRIFRDDELLVVPYAVDGTLVVYAVRYGRSEPVVRRRLPHGTVYTDELIASVSGLRGKAIDLEREIYDFDADRTREIRIARIRDLASLLERLNRCGSRHEAVYYLRLVVTRLCSSSFPGFFGAKNLQPEVRNLNVQLADLLNGPFAHRLRLPVRILVRNISGIASRPNLIDEVWTDTIELAEVHVRGSAITNELRRSTHHALGKETLHLAQAYVDYLETGNTQRLPEALRGSIAPADEEARTRRTPLVVVRRLVEALGTLLGSAQIATRLEEWRESYADTLVRCESGNRLQEELEGLVARGIRPRNKWVFHHHLRTLLRKAGAGAWSTGPGDAFRARLEALQGLDPAAAGFDVDGTERQVRECVGAFVTGIREDHQDGLFRSLQAATAIHERGDFFEAFARISELRDEIEGLLEHGAFAEQRYLLHQLDCLLEEMGYYALSHLATAYAEGGVRLEECLRVIRTCASNLGHDGLFSRELWDLTTVLEAPARTSAELLDVLESIQRNYHKVVHRVGIAYEAMGGQLGLDDDEVRAVQGNFQRYLHDLNSMVHFADIARTHIQDGRADDRERRGPRPPAAAEQPDPWDFVHLSHTEDIVQRVTSRGLSHSLQECYGGKGSGLMYFSYLGVPTRDAFIIPTALPRLGLHGIERRRLQREVLAHLRILEADVGRRDGIQYRYGRVDNPLLLAVRGGSVFSMPGMLSTVVFAGMNDRIAESLARDDPWYAYDAYRRFLGSYAAVVWDLNLEEYDLVEQAKRRHGVQFKHDLPPEALQEVAEVSKTIIRKAGFSGELEEILDDPERQLLNAVHAVFESWNRDRAHRYREIKGLSHTWQTAVIVQQMASGNRSNAGVRPGMDETAASLTGVIMQTRMSELGYRTFKGDIKFSASGDDLVGGLTAATSFRPVGELRKFTPMLDRRLHHIDAKLRRFCGTDQEIEFTVDRGRLSILQTRMAHGAPADEASTFDAPGLPDSRGIGIRGGAFRGLVAFDDADIERLTARLADGCDDVDGVLLILENPIPGEIPVILSAGGLLTARGGSTSHAAVTIHAIDDRPFCAVLSAQGLRVNPRAHEANLVDTEGRTRHTLRAGDIVSIHGQSGEVFVGPRRVIGADASIPASQPAHTPVLSADPERGPARTRV